MAQAQIQLKPYSRLEKESFREFEHLLRSYLAVAGIANAQQAIFCNYILEMLRFDFSKLYRMPYGLILIYL